MQGSLGVSFTTSSDDVDRFGRTRFDPFGPRETDKGDIGEVDGAGDCGGDHGARSEVSTDGYLTVAAGHTTFHQNVGSDSLRSPLAFGLIVGGRGRSSSASGGGRDIASGGSDPEATDDKE